LAGTCERLRESSISSADILGSDRDRVTIRIALACGARRRKELPGSCCRPGRGEGKLIIPLTLRSGALKRAGLSLRPIYYREIITNGMDNTLPYPHASQQMG